MYILLPAKYLLLVDGAGHLSTIFIISVDKGPFSSIQKELLFEYVFVLEAYELHRLVMPLVLLATAHDVVIFFISYLFSQNVCSHLYILHIFIVRIVIEVQVLKVAAQAFGGWLLLG